MDRFSHVIRFSLFGHTHDDSFNVVKSVYSKRNVGMSFISGSVTTYTNNNPNFAVLEVDEETMLPINY